MPHQIDKLKDWLRGQAGPILTEPLTVSALADYFKCDRKKMATILKHIDGVKILDRRYQVPVSEMPVGYFLSSGLIEPLRLSDFVDS